MPHNRLMRYNWQQSDWPNFRYSLNGLGDDLLTFAEKTGHVGGIVKSLPDDMQSEATIDLIVTEAVKSSEIEGEFLSREDVMSSIRNNLGLSGKQTHVHDPRAKGIAELMIDMRHSIAAPLTKEMLFRWHEMLMEGNRRVKKGCWRTHEEPMQVVSGAMPNNEVHFEAPHSKDVPKKMKRFIEWFNDTGPGGKHEIKPAPVRSAMVHLYFETIHPFEDGNGRIGRILSEKALAQGLGRPALLSLSKTIDSGKKDYYEALKNAQESNEITGWIHYFVRVILSAQIEAEQLVEFILQKTRFFDRYREKLSARHIKVINRMLSEGPKGFKGGMSTKKYVSLTGVSKATATRDLQYLMDISVLRRIGGGRSIRYDINLK